MTECLPQSLVVRVQALRCLSRACDRSRSSLAQPRAQGVGEVGRQMGEAVDDLTGVFHERGAIADQPMAATGPGVVDRPGNGEDLASRFAGLPGGDQRTGLLCRFHDQCAQRQSGEDPVARREVAAHRGRAGRVLADHGPCMASRSRRRSWAGG